MTRQRIHVLLPLSTAALPMSALDADVIKTYVELGLGVGIVAYRLIELCAPALTEAAVREALSPRKDEMNLD